LQGSGIPPEEAFEMHLLAPDQKHVSNISTPCATPAPINKETT
jgi:hypothetical protein